MPVTRDDMKALPALERMKKALEGRKITAEWLVGQWVRLAGESTDKHHKVAKGITGTKPKLAKGARVIVETDQDLLVETRHAALGIQHSAIHGLTKLFDGYPNERMDVTHKGAINVNEYDPETFDLLRKKSAEVTKAIARKSIRERSK